jgi:hypothetical protein
MMLSAVSITLVLSMATVLLNWLEVTMLQTVPIALALSLAKLLVKWVDVTRLPVTSIMLVLRMHMEAMMSIPLVSPMATRSLECTGVTMLTSVSVELLVSPMATLALK